MSSPLDPVSGPLYFFGFLGGFPLVPVSDNPSDWDWDNCSSFKKNRFRFAWCYIMHTLVFTVLLSIYWGCTLQDMSLYYYYDLTSNGLVNKYGLTMTDVLIMYAELGILYLNTFVYIYQLNKAEQGLSLLCFSVSRISEALVSERELKLIARRNLRELLIIFLILISTVPAAFIIWWHTMYHTVEGFNEGRAIAAGITFAFIYVFFGMSLPTVAGFLIFKQSVNTVKAMLKNYAKQILPQSHHGRLIKNQHRFVSPPPPYRSNMNSLQNSKTATPAWDRGRSKQDPSPPTIDDINQMLEYGNDLADILQMLQVTFTSLLATDTLVVVLLAICNFYIVISQIMILVMTTPLNATVNITIAIGYGMIGSLYMYKLLSLVYCATSLEEEVEELWTTLREVSILKFRQMIPEQIYDLTALREKLKNMMEALFKPKGLFHLGKGLVVGTFSTVIGYFLILVGFRSQEINAILESSKNTTKTT